MERFRVRSIEELESIHGGAVKLAGAALGVESFGLQVLDFPPGFSQYPEHDHVADGQEEVYVLLRGSALFEVGADRLPLEAGAMLHVAPESRRTLTAGPDGVRILAIGAVPGGAYERPGDFRLPERS